MRLIFISSYVDSYLEDSLQNSKTIITASTTTFQRALIQGFKQQDINIDVINVADIGSFPKRSKRLFIPSITYIDANLKITNGSYINLTYFKRLSIQHTIERELERLCRRYSEDNEPIVLLVYSLIYPYIKAAINIKNKFKDIYICPIVADLPEYFGDTTSFISRILPDITKRIKSLYADFDSNIVLTLPMLEQLHALNKPFLLMEGIFNPFNIEKLINKKEGIVMYSGKLDLRFGIDILLKAFSHLNNPNYQLWIYGTGAAQPIVEAAVKGDSRIKYFGFRPQPEIIQAQKEATILVNPRQNIGTYTKYSFPSKTMEYMASETPVIMYKLDGVPHEYDEYLIYPKDNSAEELANTIQKWLTTDSNIRRDFGYKAKQFIIHNKNARKQASRIINFLKENYGK